MPQRSAWPTCPDPSLDLYPAKRNDRYTLDRPVTDEKINTNYNNFYEFGSTKQIARAAQALKLRPWQVKLDGMVEKEQVLDIDDLLRKVGSRSGSTACAASRPGRCRCRGRASRWRSWSNWRKPLSSAKYVRMETFHRLGDRARAAADAGIPGPMSEGLTIAEATNELTFMVTGAYGKPVKQMGAPIRLAVPWKYGFKSVKSIVRFTFTDQRPKSFWEALQASEYGFWANVNPQVAHPRWSQATEEVIGTNERKPTLLFNGYGEYVADLYKGLEKERLWA